MRLCVYLSLQESCNFNWELENLLSFLCQLHTTDRTFSRLPYGWAVSLGPRRPLLKGKKKMFVFSSMTTKTWSVAKSYNYLWSYSGWAPRVTSVCVQGSSGGPMPPILRFLEELEAFSLLLCRRGRGERRREVTRGLARERGPASAGPPTLRTRTLSDPHRAFKGWVPSVRKCSQSCDFNPFSALIGPI